MLNSPSHLTNGQMSKLKNWFVQPYIDMVVETLEDMGKQNTLPALMALITTPNLSRNQMQLSIAEGVADVDNELKANIVRIIGTEDENTDNIYTILYKMLHEFRLNKSPDSPFADEETAAAIDQGNDDTLYDRAYHKTKTLAFRLETDGPIPSDDVLELGFLAVVQQVLANIQIDQAPITNVVEEKIEEHPLQVYESDSDESDLALAIELSKQHIQESEDDDELALAIELSKQTPSMLNQYNLIPAQAPEIVENDFDEQLARILQEEEDAAYAARLSSYSARPE